MMPPLLADAAAGGGSMEQSNGNKVDETRAVDSAKTESMLETVGAVSLGLSSQNKKRNSVGRALLIAERIPQQAGTAIDLTSDFICARHKAGKESVKVSGANVSNNTTISTTTVRGQTQSGSKQSSSRR